MSANFDPRQGIPGIIPPNLPRGPGPDGGHWYDASTFPNDLTRKQRELLADMIDQNRGRRPQHPVPHLYGRDYPYNPTPALHPDWYEPVWDDTAQFMLVGFQTYYIRDLDDVLEALGVLRGGTIDGQCWKIENWIRIVLKMPRHAPSPVIRLVKRGTRDVDERVDEVHRAEGAGLEGLARERHERSRYVPAEFIQKISGYGKPEWVEVLYPSPSDLGLRDRWVGLRYTGSPDNWFVKEAFTIPITSRSFYMAMDQALRAIDASMGSLPAFVKGKRSNPPVTVDAEGELSAFNVLIMATELFGDDWKTVDEIQSVWTRAAHQQVDWDACRRALDALVSHGVAESDGDRYRLLLMDVA